MVKFLKPGKVAIVLSGRYAGKKVVIVKNFDEGTKERPYGHAVVAGIERYPLKVTRKMGQKRIAKRSRIKPFIKVINYNHLMPTRYTFELEDLKQTVTQDCFKEPSQRNTAKKAVKKALQERYKAGKSKWFFTKLRF
ncbi:ribosomal L27e protein family-domain-containing protein [Glomus cerebriforme]|uniref:60S ribosomal protein L27 n=1 Tax=Glomus cerebriforme TaxID=658196 RepID=A0A397TF54_9GLOM|nr:ribosomal L27e protein family-domain-containing protein [Glomus cerebriforme]